MSILPVILIVICLNIDLVGLAVSDQDCGAYNEKPSSFKLINIDGPGFINFDDFEMPDGSFLPASKIIDSSKDDISMISNACAFEISMENYKEKVVFIDDIIAKVHSYRPLPKNGTPISSSQLSYEPANIYYAEIDKNSAETKSADARIVIDGKIQDPETWSMKLKKNEPEKFIIRINAKDPGIYTLSFIVKSRCDDDRECDRILDNGDQPYMFAFYD